MGDEVDPRWLVTDAVKLTLSGLQLIYACILLLILPRNSPKHTLSWASLAIAFFFFIFILVIFVALYTSSVPQRTAATIHIIAKEKSSFRVNMISHILAPGKPVSC
mmetsp:Transcript_11337/g.27892  ORF Transcript_11337/g.27892 Transcript_11337/m.27892 type:complete len:106 (+) Transcript_11337:72-389(+)